MKRFLLKCSLFLLPLILVWGAAELFYRATENNYSYKYQRINAYKINANILVLGDSHTFFGICPSYLETPTFNLAGISQSLYFDELLLESYINELPELKRVVLMVNYTTLSKVNDTGEDLWRKYFYDQEMHLEVPTVKFYDMKRYSLALTRKANRTYRSFKKYLNEGTLVGVDSLGWGNYYTVENSLDILATAKVVTKRHEDGLIDFSANTERLERMIQLCKSNDVKVTIVSMPVTTSYSTRINAEKWQKSVNSCTAIAKKHEHVTYYNFFDDNQFNDSDFYDANHLNNKGAKKFTQLLNGLIKQ